MQQISDPGAVHAVLNDPAYTVPPVPPGDTGLIWLRATVSRFSNGEVHARRRALVVGLLDTIDPDALRASVPAHPVVLLADALGVDGSTVEDDVRLIAAAYQPGSGPEGPAVDAAVARVVGVFGGAYDEPTAARICLLVQACAATTTLIDRAKGRDLSDDPPVVATKRQAPTGEIVLLSLRGDPDLAFAAGPRRCPGRLHALAIVEGARR